MRVVKSSSFGNAALIGELTYRQVFLYFGVIVIGALLLNTPLFAWNFFAIVAYLGFAFLCIGFTPTRRPTVSNIYGVLFRKPSRMLVTKLSTVTTLGHGIREVIVSEEFDTPAFRLVNGNYAFVYHVTSRINQWSVVDDYEELARSLEKVLTIMEAGENFQVVTKVDSDTGMLVLRDKLADGEQWEGDDYARMSRRRLSNLERAATLPEAKSPQQYLIVQVKLKNANRVLEAVRKSARVIRPASYPGDVILAAAGFEVYEDELGGDKGVQ